MSVVWRMNLILSFSKWLPICPSNICYKVHLDPSDLRCHLCHIFNFPMCLSLILDLVSLSMYVPSTAILIIKALYSMSQCLLRLIPSFFFFFSTVFLAILAFLFLHINFSVNLSGILLVLLLGLHWICKPT